MVQHKTSLSTDVLSSKFPHRVTYHLSNKLNYVILDDQVHPLAKLTDDLSAERKNIQVIFLGKCFFFLSKVSYFIGLS